MRRTIGVAGQNATLDEVLTGRENLEMIGRLFRLTSADARSAANDLLERFDLQEPPTASRRPTPAASDAASTSPARWSPSRRSSSSTSRPPVSTRAAPLDVGPHRGLAKGGTTVLMTTQYLEEADLLADDIA